MPSHSTERGYAKGGSKGNRESEEALAQDKNKENKSCHLEWMITTEVEWPATVWTVQGRQVLLADIFRSLEAQRAE